MGIRTRSMPYSYGHLNPTKTHQRLVLCPRYLRPASTQTHGAMPSCSGVVIRPLSPPLLDRGPGAGRCRQSVTSTGSPPGEPSGSNLGLTHHLSIRDLPPTVPYRGWVRGIPYDRRWPPLTPVHGKRAHFPLLVHTRITIMRLIPPFLIDEH